MDPSKQSLLGASAAFATYDPSALPEENPSPSAPPDEKPAPPQIEFDNLPAYAQSAIRISTPQSAHVRGTVFSVVVLGAIGLLGAIAAGALDLPIEAGYGILAGAYVVYFIEVRAAGRHAGGHAATYNSAHSASSLFLSRSLSRPVGPRRCARTPSPTCATSSLGCRPKGSSTPSATRHPV